MAKISNSSGEIEIRVYKEPATERWVWEILHDRTVLWDAKEETYERRFDAVKEALEIASFHTFEITEEMEGEGGEIIR